MHLIGWGRGTSFGIPLLPGIFDVKPQPLRLKHILHMAWDSSTPQSGRRHGNSTAAIDAENPTKPHITPKSTHVADTVLQPFLSSAPFDPAEYLNATLPALQSPGTASSRSNNDAVPLGELSTQTQDLLSHLSAHTTRLTATLTQLTDGILRSGSRLAYEVEVLRGETVGLSEALTEGLQEDITKFVPGGLEAYLAPKVPPNTENNGTRRRSSTVISPKVPTIPKTPHTSRQTPTADPPPPAQDDDPEYIKKLRTLTLVRTRLESLIQTFGTAMAWTFPPSEISVSSSFLSVSAPEPGLSQHSTEEKGQEISKKLRDEISDLLIGTSDPVEGMTAAAKRVEELKELARVWKGTAEERGRVKFVEGLARMVEERHAEFLREGERDARESRRNREGLREEAKPPTPSNANPDGRFGGGFFGSILNRT